MNPDSQKTKWVVIALILFAPLGLALMWAWNIPWKKNIKVALSVVLGFIILAAAVAVLQESELTTMPETPIGHVGSGVLGDHEIEIVSAVREDAGEGGLRGVIVVTYKWTNNSRSNEAFDYAFDIAVKQDGINCRATRSSHDTHRATRIGQGDSLEVRRTYLAHKNSGSVEVNISFKGSGSTAAMISKTFENVVY